MDWKCVAAGDVNVDAVDEERFNATVYQLHINVNWLPISLVLSVLMWVLAYRDIKVSTRVMLGLEGVSILLVLILAFVIFFKVGFNGLSAAPIQIGTNNFSVIAQGVVLGLLSFAGFECASCLGEETRNPKRMIPLVIFGTIAGIGIFFLISSYSQIIGFGVTPDGIKALSTSAMPLSDLADKFISKQYGFLIVLALTMSLFSCVIGCVCTGARIMFSVSRDGHVHKRLADVHPKFKTPHISVNATMAASIIIQIAFYILTRGAGTDLYNYNAYVTALSMLVAYLIVNASGMVYFYRNKMWKKFHLIIPGIAIVAMMYTAYSNVYPVPAYPMNLAPYITVGFIIVMLLVSRLTKHDGIAQEDIAREMSYGA